MDAIVARHRLPGHLVEREASRARRVRLIGDAVLTGLDALSLVHLEVCVSAVCNDGRGRGPEATRERQLNAKR